MPPTCKDCSMNTCQIFAALANSDTRDMYARVILDQVPEAPTSKQSRALLDLHRAGLIDTADGAWLPSVPLLPALRGHRVHHASLGR